MLALDLNDAGIRAARADDDAPVAVDGERTCSPGVARVDRRQSITTGTAAERQTRLHPLETVDRFWDRLDTEPVRVGDPQSPNRAEVACAHLGHVLRSAHRPGEDVVFAVPASWDDRQLGYVAGIARELGVPLRGLVARPVAIDPTGPATDEATKGPVLVVDPGLHRCVLSVVHADDDEVRLLSTRDVPDVGLDTFRQQWMRAVAGELIRTTRFDPSHDATTEQQLRDRLPAVLDAIADGGTDVLELGTGTSTHRVTVTDRMLAHAGHDLLSRLCDEIRTVSAASRPAALLIAHDAARIPGLVRAAGDQTALPVRTLAADAVARGLARTWPGRYDHPEADGVAYHTRRRAGMESAVHPTANP